MDIKILNDLKINHIGIIVPVESKSRIEAESGEIFLEDEIQGVSVCFVWDEYLKTYKEYITQEGRASKYELGYNHICYDVDNQEAMSMLHTYFLKNKNGIRLTLPEPSPTKQCNIVTFYRINGAGIIEFNIVN